MKVTQSPNMGCIRSLHEAMLPLNWIQIRWNLPPQERMCLCVALTWPLLSICTRPSQNTTTLHFSPHGLFELRNSLTSIQLEYVLTVTSFPAIYNTMAAVEALSCGQIFGSFLLWWPLTEQISGSIFLVTRRHQCFASLFYKPVHLLLAITVSAIRTISVPILLLYLAFHPTQSQLPDHFGPLWSEPFSGSMQAHKNQYLCSGLVHSA